MFRAVLVVIVGSVVAGPLVLLWATGRWESQRLDSESEAMVVKATRDEPNSAFLATVDWKDWSLERGDALLEVCESDPRTSGFAPRKDLADLIPRMLVRATASDAQGRKIDCLRTSTDGEGWHEITNPFDERIRSRLGITVVSPSVVRLELIPTVQGPDPGLNALFVSIEGVHDGELSITAGLGRAIYTLMAGMGILGTLGLALMAWKRPPQPKAGAGQTQVPSVPSAPVPGGD